MAPRRKAARRAAAKKGWATRRRNAAKRSAAARKGWAKRKATPKRKAKAKPSAVRKRVRPPSPEGLEFEGWEIEIGFDYEEA